MRIDIDLNDKRMTADFNIFQKRLDENTWKSFTIIFILSIAVYFNRCSAIVK